MQIKINLKTVVLLGNISIADAGGNHPYNAWTIEGRAANASMNKFSNADKESYMMSVKADQTGDGTR
jgi:hypothetical protein